MKKLLLVMLAVFSVPLIFFSQSNSSVMPPAPVRQSKFSIGICGGFGHSFLAPYRNYALNPSWNSGLSVVYAPWIHWGIGMDAVYSSEGATFTSGGDLDFTKTLDYIRVPIKAIYYFNKYENDFRPKISFGPTLGFLVGEINSSTAASFDLGANLAAGFNYRLIRAVWLNVDVSYYQGFLDVSQGNDIKDLNGNVRVNFGLNFGF